MTIDHEGRVPVYRQLAEIIRGQIDRGEIEEDRPIPARDRLMTEYGVARGTVDRALNVLKNEGYVEAVIGRGMFVVPAAERAGRAT
ncbi:MAG: GntR family transcriptional regulator [Streptosporangiaceae bacterium]